MEIVLKGERLIFARDEGVWWKSDQQRVINSFELIGAATLVDPLKASQWCETRPEDRNDRMAA